MKMNIAIISGTFHPDSGGPSTYLLNLLPELSARGHDLRVLTFGEPHAHDYGYPVIRQTRTQRIPLRLLNFSRKMVTLLRWADVLYINGYVFPLLWLRWLYRGRVVAKIVGDFTWEYAYRNQLTTLDAVAFQSAPHTLKLRLLRAVYFRAVGLADTVIVPSEHLARVVRMWGYPSERIKVVYNGIPESDLHTVERAALRHALGLPLDVPLLLYVARLIPLKGAQVAVAALDHLPSDY
ncbi:MAG: glycosyltransferase family 4 protein, partial [Armatimonadetes bacterium]|nr:glycosyltransferase family 4 protein [Anaerolineae bacterium]